MVVHPRTKLKPSTATPNPIIALLAATYLQSNINKFQVFQKQKVSTIFWSRRDAMRLVITVGLLLSPCHAFASKYNRWGPSIRLSAHGDSSDYGVINGESQPPCLKTADVLSLDSIRSTLIRQEETIIFALIERAQFRQNSIAYERGGFGDLGIPVGSTPIDDDDTKLSFLEYMLVGTVRMIRAPPLHSKRIKF
jgi:hypothetical protein